MPQSISPDYWKLTYVKAMEHQKTVFNRFKSPFPFRAQTWNFSTVNERAAAGDYAYMQNINFSSGGLAGFLNWRDNCEENSPDFTIFNNDWYLSQRFLPGFQLTHLYPNGIADAKRIRDWAKEADYWAMVLRQYEWRWANYAGPNGEYRAEWNPKGQNCVDKITEALNKIYQYSNQLRQNNNNNPFRFPDLLYTNSPYEKMYTDRSYWTSTEEYRAMKEADKKINDQYFTRAGFVNGDVLLNQFLQVFAVVGTVADVIMKAGLIVGATVTGGALATAIAPTIGAGLGVSTGVAGTAIQGGAVAAVSGGNPLSILTPVLGDAANNLTKGDGKVGFLDDITKTIGGTSLAGIGSAVDGFKIPTLEGAYRTVGDVIGGITPAQIIDVVAPKQATLPVPAQQIPLVPVAVTQAVKQAALPVGAIVALVALYFFAKGGK